MNQQQYDLQNCLTKLDATRKKLAECQVELSLVSKQVAAMLHFFLPKGTFDDLTVIETIQVFTANAFNVPIDSMKSARRMEHIAWPRQVAMSLSREFTAQSLTEIGKAFGGRDHSTVFHAMHHVAERCSTEEQAKLVVESLRGALRATLFVQPEAKAA